MSKIAKNVNVSYGSLMAILIIVIILSVVITLILANYFMYKPTQIIVPKTSSTQGVVSVYVIPGQSEAYGVVILNVKEKPEGG